MPKRKAAKDADAADSDLLPTLEGQPDAQLVVNGSNRSSKKRKVKEVKEEVSEEPTKANSTTRTKRKKRSAALKKQVNADTVVKAELNKEPVKSKHKRQSKEEKRAAASKVVEEEVSEVPSEADGSKPKKGKASRKEKADADALVNGEVSEKSIKTKRKRKTKEEKKAEAMPIAARTQGHKLFIGAHVSSAGGVHNSVLNSVHIGANAFALFLKSQRKWTNPPLVADHCTSFHDHCKSQPYDQSKHVVPHGSYLVNLAHVDKARTDQAYESFLDDLKRCERLGIKLYNFHPGVANSADRPTAIAHLASNINRAHKATSTVVTLLENMAHGGNTLGSTFEDLRDTIALIHDKKRVGVCLDTCHAFAGGYDLRTPAAFKETMDHFEDVVGFEYLRAMHINDSKAPFASHKDLHANIGTGFLGLRAFHNIVNEPRFQGLPLILETPLNDRDDDGVLLKDDKGKEKEDKGIWAREIKLLESMVGMDTESDEFLKQEKALARKGEPERKRLTDQIERKQEKDAKKKMKDSKKQGKKAKEDADEDSSLSELESDAEDDGAGDTQRFAE